MDRPTKKTDTDPTTGKYWTLEPVGGYFAPTAEPEGRHQYRSVHVAGRPGPTSWRDPIDPGWKGKWNGYFGKNKFSADEETYFVMDDNNDERFNSFNNNIWACRLQA